MCLEYLHHAAGFRQGNGRKQREAGNRMLRMADSQRHTDRQAGIFTDPITFNFVWELAGGQQFGLNHSLHDERAAAKATFTHLRRRHRRIFPASCNRAF